MPMKARKTRLIGFTVTLVSKRKIRRGSMRGNRLRRKTRVPKKTGECQQTQSLTK